MAKQRLTDRKLISGVTLTDLLHFVVTGDTTQNPAGSSFKGNVEQLFGAFSAYTCTNPLIVDVVNACNTGITINGNVTINGSATTINTEVIQSKDNNIVLNYSGTHLTAIGGGITLEDGQSNGVDSRIYTDSNGTWLFDPGLSASTGTIDTLSACTGIYTSNLYGCSPIIVHDDIRMNSGKYIESLSGTSSLLMDYLSTPGSDGYVLLETSKGTTPISEQTSIYLESGGYSLYNNGNSFSNDGAYLEMDQTYQGGVTTLIQKVLGISSNEELKVGMNHTESGSGVGGLHIVAQNTVNKTSDDIKSYGTFLSTRNSTFLSGTGTFNSVIIGGREHTVTNNNEYSVVVGGDGNYLDSVSNSVILGGNGLTGSTDNTVYVPYLNINNLGTGTSINNLGIDSSGNVVTGNTTVDTNFAITDLTFTGDRVHDLNGYTPTLKDEKDDQTRLIVENLFNGASANSAVSVRSRGPNATTISGTILYGGDSFTGYGSFTDGASGLLTNAFTMTSLGGTPNQRGHINIGSRRATDAEVRIFNGSDDFDFTSLGAKFTTTGFTSYQDVYIDNLPSESVLGTDANGKIIAGTGGGTFTGNTSGDCITDLYLTNLYGCSPLHIEPSGLNNVYIVENGGNVGIGTTGATEKLHVSGGDILVETSNGKFYSDLDDAVGTVIKVSGGTNGLVRMFTKAGSGSISVGHRGITEPSFPGYGKPGDGFLYSSAEQNGLNIISQQGTSKDDYIRFYVGQITGAVPANTPDIHIQGSGATRGNVGINTKTPTEKLHVEGSVRIVDGTEQNGYVLTSDANGVGSWVASAAFTGNTSGDCITDLYLTNLYGCSPLHIEPSGLNNLYLVENGGNVGIGTTATTVTLNVVGQTKLSGSGQNVLTVIGSGSGSTTPLFTVQGDSGELFSITDDLTGSLFAVNDASGLPILEVFDDDTVHMGSYQAPSLNTTVKLNPGTGLSTVYSLPMSAYTGAFFDYTVSNTGGARAGQIMSIFSGNTVNFTETTTTDIGSTSDVTFTMSADSTNTLLQVSATTTGWEVKTIVRSI